VDEELADYVCVLVQNDKTETEIATVRYTEARLHTCVCVCACVCERESGVCVCVLVSDSVCVHVWRHIPPQCTGAAARICSS
jgi:hypothetical protein